MHDPLHLRSVKVMTNQNKSMTHSLSPDAMTISLACLSEYTHQAGNKNNGRLSLNYSSSHTYFTTRPRRKTPKVRRDQIRWRGPLSRLSLPHIMKTWRSFLLKLISPPATCSSFLQPFKPFPLSPIAIPIVTELVLSCCVALHTFKTSDGYATSGRGCSRGVSDVSRATDFSSHRWQLSHTCPESSVIKCECTCSAARCSPSTNILKA